MLIRRNQTGGKAKPLKAPKKKVVEEDEEDKVRLPFRMQQEPKGNKLIFVNRPSRSDRKEV